MNDSLQGWLRRFLVGGGEAAGVSPEALAARFQDQIVRSLSEGVLVLSAGGQVLFFNPAAERILERKLQGGETIDWVALREDGTRMMAEETPMARALVEHLPLRNVVLGDISPSGTLRWLNVTAETLPGAPGVPTAAVVSFTDISDRRRAEQELQLHREQLEGLVVARTSDAELARRRFSDFALAAPVPICAFDRDGALTLANHRFWQCFGYLPSEILGLEDWWQRAYPDPAYRREIARHWLDLQNPESGGGGGNPVEQRVTCADGRVRIMEVAAVALHDGYLATFVDVSERLESEARVQEIAELNLKLIEAATQGMVLYSANGRCVLANEAAADLLGSTRSELLGQNFRELESWESQGLLAAAIRALDAGGRQRIECQFKNSRGQLHWLAVDIVRFSRQREPHLLVMFDDITTYRTEEFRLREDKRAAEDANRVKSAFLASMSHEIRNPLNAIMGMAQVLSDDRLDAEQRGLVETISAAGRSLLEIVNDVLDFAKIEAGRLEVEAQAFSVTQLLTRAQQLWSTSAEQKGLTLLLDPLPRLPEQLIGDPQRLAQILSNFISNAIKFTDSGHVRIGIEQISDEPDRLTLRFRIRDTGSGIPPDKQILIFDPFTQLDDPGSTRNAGTGLGLAISRELATLMGGGIGVHSSPGLGSEFWVELPFRRADATASREGETPTGQPAQAGALAGLSVLVVDDNAVNLEVAGRLLQREGARVLTAASGRDAIGLLERIDPPPQIVLMDVQMPGMDGIEATARIRALPVGSALGVIALSAGNLPRQREDTMHAGMDGFISKPFELREMVSAILDVQARRHRRAAAHSPALAVVTASAPIPGMRAPRAAAMQDAAGGEGLRFALPAAATEAAAAAGAVAAGLAAKNGARAGSLPAGAFDGFSDAHGFPDIRGHVLALAVRRMHGDRALYLRSLRLFDAELARTSRDLGLELHGVHPKALARILHRLKGAAGMVAALDIANLAEALEQVVAGLEAPQSEATDPPLLPSAELREAMVQTIAACERQRRCLVEDLRALPAGTLTAPPPAVDRPAAAAAADAAAPDPEAHLEQGVQSLVALLDRHDLRAIDSYREIERALGALLSGRQDRELRMALDVLAFERAAVILREVLANQAPSAERRQAP